MRLVAILVSSIFLLASCASSPVQTKGSMPGDSPASTKYGEPMPLYKGSLANEKLIQDALVGVKKRVASLGCDRPEGFEPWVMQEPEGEPGSRVWHEKWVVDGCGTTYPIYLRFNESGMGAADWAVK